MIYPKNYEHKIGFTDIKALLNGFCQSNLGKERVEELQMIKEVSQIRQKQQETQELKTILEEVVELPEMAFYDLRPSIQRIRLEGAHIEEDDLSKLKKSLDTLHSWLKIIRTTGDDQEELTNPSSFTLRRMLFNVLLTLPSEARSSRRMRANSGLASSRILPYLSRVLSMADATAMKVKTPIDIWLRAG